MAVATARPNWKDALSGGKQATLSELERKRHLPDYGPFSSRVVYPTGKYLFSADHQLPTRIGRARKMTPGDFQIVTLYSDLSRRDIGYLQSIARIYDVTQMRELIQCRLNHMGKKKRCLDVTRHEDFEAYGGYLEKKYGRRMPELMPMIHTHPRPPKVWPRVTEYPVVRSQPRLRHTARKDPRLVPLSHANVSDQEESGQKDSNVTMQGSEPDGAKMPRKTSLRKEKPAEKPAKTVQKPAAEKVASKGVRKSETGVPSGTSGTSKERSSKTIPAQRKSHPRTTETKEQVNEVNGLQGMRESGFESRDAKDAIVVSPSEYDKAKLGPSLFEPKGTSKKDAAEELSFGKGGEVLPHSSHDAKEKSVDFVDMFCSPTENENVIFGTSSFERKGVEARDRDEDDGTGYMEKAVPGDAVEAEKRYADDKFEEPTGSDMAGTSEEHTPEIAKSTSLEGFEGVFSPEYDDVTGQSVSGKGQAEFIGDFVYQEDVKDQPAEKNRPDEPAGDLDEETVKEMENTGSLTPLWRSEDDDETVQVFPPDTSPFEANGALDSEAFAAPAYDTYSKDQSRFKDEYISSEADFVQESDQQKQTETSETKVLATTSGDGERYDDDVRHESPTASESSPPF